MRLLRDEFGHGFERRDLLHLLAGVGERLNAGFEMLLVVIEGLTLGFEG
jgi:hypothetical protein